MSHPAYRIIPPAVCCILLACPATAAFAQLLPVELIPPAFELPGSWFVVKPLLLLTFFIHIILVNILIGSTIYAFFNSLRPLGTGVNTSNSDTAFIPKILALAVNFGVAPFLFLQVLYNGYLYTSSVLMAVWWLSIIAVVMLAYYALYIVNSGVPAALAQRRAFLGLIACMLLYTAFVWSTQTSMMTRPESWLRWGQNPGGTLLNLGDPSFIPRFLHVVFASVAIGGLVAAWRGRLGSKKSVAEQTVSAEHSKNGLYWFWTASLCQGVAGIWYLFALPPAVRAFFLGGNSLGTAALVLALLGLALAVFFALNSRLTATSAAALGIILIMVCMRDIARDLALVPYTKATAAMVKPLPVAEGQHIALLFFLVCAVVAALAVVWVLRAAFRAYRQTRLLEAEE